MPPGCVRRRTVPRHLDAQLAPANAPVKARNRAILRCFAAVHLRARRDGSTRCASGCGSAPALHQRRHQAATGAERCRCASRRGDSLAWLIGRPYATALQCKRTIPAPRRISCRQSSAPRPATTPTEPQPDGPISASAAVARRISAGSNERMGAVSMTSRVPWSSAQTLESPSLSWTCVAQRGSSSSRAARGRGVRNAPTRTPTARSAWKAATLRRRTSDTPCGRRAPGGRCVLPAARAASPHSPGASLWPAPSPRAAGERPLRLAAARTARASFSVHGSRRVELRGVKSEIGLSSNRVDTSGAEVHKALLRAAEAQCRFSLAAPHRARASQSPVGRAQACAPPAVHASTSPSNKPNCPR